MIYAGQGGLFDVGGLEPAVTASPAEAQATADTWLDAVLEAGAGWRRSARARLAPCRKCGALTLYAADMALDLMTESRVDVRVLDRGLEVQALMAGRYTAEVEPARHGGGPLIYRRDRWLAAKEPNARRRLWVPEHVCWDPLGWEIPLEIIYPAEARAARRDTSRVDPPF